MKILPLSDGGAVVGSLQLPVGDVMTKPFIMRFDSDGNSLWLAKLLGSGTDKQASISDLIETSNG